MLATSKLYSFLSKSSRFNIVFFEGQKLIHDLSLLHEGENTFSFFRDTVLSFQPLIYFLKDGENFGIYLDSETPYFRFKIETNSFGQTRTLLLPEVKKAFSKVKHGQCRVLKLSPKQASPYTSTIEIVNDSASEISNNVIKQSYQTDAMVVISKNVDSSVLIHKLPHKILKGEESDHSRDEDLTVKEFYLQHKETINKLLDKNFHNEEDITNYFSKDDFTYLYGKDICFNCPCSREQMIHNMARLALSDINHLFKDDLSVEVTCDYCKKQYLISKEDVSHASKIN